VDDDRLLAVLERSRSLGFLGPGPVTEHVRHAVGFVEALEEIAGRVVDLGAGGGVPGLVIGLARPDLEVVLVDAMAKRCRFLEEAVRTLDVAAAVVEGRAEDIGRGPLRGSADAVVARGFGPPAATAECAAPLLRVGGRLVVSEPPVSSDRWNRAGLARLGLQLGRRRRERPVMQVLEQVRACPEAYPRRRGVPTKRPLF